MMNKYDGLASPWGPRSGPESQGGKIEKIRKEMKIK